MGRAVSRQLPLFEAPAAEDEPRARAYAAPEERLFLPAAAGAEYVRLGDPRVHPERVRVAGLALELVRAHEPVLESHLRIEWSPKFTARVGDARLIPHDDDRPTNRLPKNGWTARVRFSLPLWPKLPLEERDNTVAHELAHLICFVRQLTGRLPRHRREHRKPHSKLWRGVMEELGYEPSVRCTRGTPGKTMSSPHRLRCIRCGAPVYVGRRRYQNAAKLLEALRAHDFDLWEAWRARALPRRTYSHAPCQETHGWLASLLIPDEPGS